MPEVPTNPDRGECPSDEALAALLDGGVAADERASIEAHALDCDACRAALAEAARALATLDGTAAAPRSPAARRPLARFAAAAAILVCAAGAAGWFALRGRPIVDSNPMPVPARADLIVAEVSGGAVEARDPGIDGVWRPLAAGDRVVPGLAVRVSGGEPATVVFEDGLSIALRREAEATLKPGPASLDITLASGAVAASPAPGAGTAIRIEVPQGTVTSAGAPLEVHVRRRGGGALVVARDAGGILCATPHGEVRLDAGNHTLLFNDRPPMPPKAFPFRKRGRGGEGRGPGGRPRCAPPGGPELDELFKSGDGPT